MLLVTTQLSLSLRVISGMTCPLMLCTISASVPSLRGNWNFRTKELSFPGTFVPMTDIKGELSFPNIGYYCLVMILKGNLNS